MERIVFSLIVIILNLEGRTGLKKSLNHGDDFKTTLDTLDCSNAMDDSCRCWDSCHCTKADTEHLRLVSLAPLPK
jgi:hypothetical protein